VHPRTIRERTTELRGIGARLGRRFRERMLGSTQRALILDATAADGSSRALTGNYIEVLLPAAAAVAGDLVSARLLCLESDGKTVRAEVVA
jgi:hypothetical protein